MDVPEGAKTVLSASPCGRCGSGQHNRCRKAYRPFHFEKKGRKEVLVYSDFYRLCSCKCHGKVKADSKARKQRRKK